MSTSPFVKIIIPVRWNISRCRLKSRIIAQLCLGLVTTKGYFKMCSYYKETRNSYIRNWTEASHGALLGAGGRWAQNLSDLIAICPLQRNSSVLHRADQVFYCGMLNVGHHHSYADILKSGQYPDNAIDIHIRPFPTIAHKICVCANQLFYQLFG